MFKCSQCIFYDKCGFQDMGFTIPDCKFIMVDELRKKNCNQEYDLFKSLIHDELQAENCKFFTFICEAVDIIKDLKK